MRFDFDLSGRESGTPPAFLLVRSTRLLVVFYKTCNL